MRPIHSGSVKTHTRTNSQLRIRHRTGLCLCVWYPDHVPLYGLTLVQGTQPLCCIVGHALMGLVLGLALKGVQSLCLEFRLIEAVLISRRLIFGYLHILAVAPHSALGRRHWTVPFSPPLRRSSSQLSLFHLPLCVCVKPSSCHPLSDSHDSDLALVLSTCRERNLAVTRCWDIIPAAGVTFAESRHSSHHVYYIPTLNIYMYICIYTYSVYQRVKRKPPADNISCSFLISALFIK